MSCEQSKSSNHLFTTYLTMAKNITNIFQTDWLTSCKKVSLPSKLQKPPQWGGSKTNQMFCMLLYMPTSTWQHGQNSTVAISQPPPPLDALIEEKPLVLDERKLRHGMEFCLISAGKDVLLFEMGDSFSSVSGRNFGLLWDRALALADCVAAM